MKQLVVIVLIGLIQAVNISAQVVGSGRSSVHINNQTPTLPDSELRQPEVEAPVTLPREEPEEILVPTGDYYALIIGIDNYADPMIQDLDNPIRDAELFHNTLINYYTFDPDNVRLLRDATMADMVGALDHFSKVVTPEDNFLIFYAGHGIWNEDAGLGFWLPADAQQNSTLNWFRNSTLRDYLRAINSKHSLLVSDACFAGGIFRTRRAFLDAPVAINRLYDLPSRKAMTSGTLTEVPDQSAFLKYMIDRLENNDQRYLSSEQLFSSFRIAVINNSDAIPQYGEIRDVGDEGGDFIFIRRQAP
jgi:hypothetical protein